MRRRLAVVSAVMLIAASCSSSGASAEQLAWCTRNEAQVARVALDAGLMPNGALFSDWKQSDQVDYQRACKLAAEQI